MLTISFEKELMRQVAGLWDISSLIISRSASILGFGASIPADSKHDLHRFSGAIRMLHELKSELPSCQR
jgi:hypothetical protein